MADSTTSSVIDGVPTPSSESDAPNGSPQTSALPSLALPWSVESVLADISSSEDPSEPPPKTPIPLLHMLERLKTTPREGWRRFNVPNSESIADHMYRMSIMTLLAPTSLSSRLNIAHCTHLALVHDMAESLVGDITPMDNVPKEEKARRERDTMAFFAKHMLGGYEKGEQGVKLRSLWEEYEAGQTAEAIFVKDVDKVELTLQMVEYEKRGDGALDLDEFTRVGDRVKGVEMKGWVDELIAERNAYWKTIKDEKG